MRKSNLPLQVSVNATSESVDLSNEKNEEDAEDELALTEDNDIHLCVLHRNSKLACAYYDAIKHSLFTLADVNESVQFELVELLINELRPRAIITSARTDANFINFLKIKCKYDLHDSGDRTTDTTLIDDHNDDDDDDEENAEDEQEARSSRRRSSGVTRQYKAKSEKINLVRLIANDFHYDSAKRRIMQLDGLELMPEAMSESERIVYFSGLFDFDAKLMIGATGALLKYMERAASSGLGAGGEGDDLFAAANTELSAFRIDSVRPVRLGHLMLIDQHALQSLQIFSGVDLACAHKLTETLAATRFRTSFNPSSLANDCAHTNNNNKNGETSSAIVTLYGLYSSRIQTKIGLAKLRSYMMQPTRDPHVLAKRHRLVDYFVHETRHKAAEMTKSVRQQLRRCKFIGRTLKRMRITRCSLAEWKRLYKTTRAFCRLAQLAKQIAADTCPYIDESGVNARAAAAAADLSFNPPESSITAAATTTTYQRGQRTSASATASSSSLLDAHLFARLITRDYTAKFNYLSELYERVMDVAGSDEARRCRVNVHVSYELDAKREQFAALPEYLSRIAQEELDARGHETLGDCSIIYFPQLGFLIVIKRETILQATMSDEDDVADNAHAPNYSEEQEGDMDAVTSHRLERARAHFEAAHGFEFSFRSNNQLYFKSERMRQLDAEFGDMFSEINDMEAKIIEEMQLEFIKHSHFYADMMEICGELDCLLAFASLAVEHDYVRPRLMLSNTNVASVTDSFLPASVSGQLEVDEDDEMSGVDATAAASFIRAHKVRHPLVELSAEHSLFVPNDVHTGACPPTMLADACLDSHTQTSNKIKVITAANAAGKSVYLKQVGLLVYMAMIGSYVAASEATIGDFDRIYTRMSSDESVSVQLSSFSIDSKQILNALKGSTHKSLLLIDEYGKGTSVGDGQAILAALAAHWTSMRPHATLCPHVYISTHFYEMWPNVDSLLGAESASLIDFLTFEFMLDERSRPTTTSAKAASTATAATAAVVLVHLYTLKKGVASSSHALDVAKRYGLAEPIVHRAHRFHEIIKQNLSKLSVDATDQDAFAALFRNSQTSAQFTAYKELITSFLTLGVNLNEGRESASSSELDVKAEAAEYRRWLTTSLISTVNQHNMQQTSDLIDSVNINKMLDNNNNNSNTNME